MYIVVKVLLIFCCCLKFGELPPVKNEHYSVGVKRDSSREGESVIPFIFFASLNTKLNHLFLSLLF